MQRLLDSHARELSARLAGHARPPARRTARRRSLAICCGAGW